MKQIVRSVREGADLADLNVWLMANGAPEAHLLKAAFVEGGHVHYEEFLRDERGRVRSAGNEALTAWRDVPLVLPLPRSLEAYYGTLAVSGD